MFFGRILHMFDPYFHSLPRFGTAALGSFLVTMFLVSEKPIHLTFAVPVWDHLESWTQSFSTVGHCRLLANLSYFSVFLDLQRCFQRLSRHWYLMEFHDIFHCGCTSLCSTYSRRISATFPGIHWIFPDSLTMTHLTHWTRVWLLRWLVRLAPQKHVSKLA